jgi:hypothetical protein
MTHGASKPLPAVSAARSPDVHLFRSELGPHAFVVDGSRFDGVGRRLPAWAIERLRTSAPVGFAIYQAIKDKTYRNKALES